MSSTFFEGLILKHSTLIQDEFYKTSRNVNDVSIVNKSAAAKSKNTGVNDFLRAMGDKEIRNPSPKAKKPTMKIKSLRTYEKGTAQERLFRQLYKSWKGSGSIKDVAKQHSSTIDLRNKLEAQKLKLKQMKENERAKKLQDKLNEKKKKIEQREKKKEQKVEKKKEPVIKEEKKNTIQYDKNRKLLQGILDDKSLTPSSRYRKYLAEKKNQEFKQRQKKQDGEDTTDYTQYPEEQKHKDIEISNKLEEQYDKSLEKIDQNASKLKGPIDFLPDPVKPTTGIKDAQDTTNSLNDAFDELGIKGSVADASVGPTITTYHADVDVKNIDKALTSAKKIGYLIRKPVNVVQNNNRGTIDFEVEKIW